jgi:4-amino-4-deoxy-L-arabinose transferase-like glycosyltransferase
MIQAVGLKYWFWLMLLGALVSRLGAAVAVQLYVSQTPGRLCLVTPGGDAEGYWELAGKIAAFKQYSIFDPPRRLLRMPGFPALLALPRLACGNNEIAARFPARLVLALVGAAACILTYWLGRELGGDVVGLIAGTYTVCSPTMLLFSVLFLSETAFAAALLGSLIAAAKLVRRISTIPSTGTKRLALVTGGLIGVATYMRPTWLLVGPGIAGLIVIFGPNSFRSRLFPAAGICIGLCLMMLPWTVRNAFVTGHFVPTTLWDGPSLYDGLHPKATGKSDMQFFEDDGLMTKENMSEYEMNRAYRNRAWAYAFSHPRRVIELAIVKQIYFWNPAPDSAQFNDVRIRCVAWLAYLPLILCSLIGAWLARRDIWLIILTAAPILYFAGLHLLFVGSLRYRLPAEYPLAVLAAVGIVRWYRPNGNHQPFKTIIVGDR